jgi:hypothetical protein
MSCWTAHDLNKDKLATRPYIGGSCLPNRVGKRQGQSKREQLLEPPSQADDLSLSFNSTDESNGTQASPNLLCSVSLIF